MSGEQEKRLNKLQIPITDSELRAIDEWRFENRAPSRAAAVRELVRRSLEQWQNELDKAKSDR